MIVKILIIGVFVPLVFWVILLSNKYYYKKIHYIKPLKCVCLLNSFVIYLSLSLHAFILDMTFLNLLYVLCVWSTTFLLIGFVYQVFADKYYDLFNRYIDVTKAQIKMYKYSIQGSFSISMLGLIISIIRTEIVGLVNFINNKGIGALFYCWW